LLNLIFVVGRYIIFMEKILLERSRPAMSNLNPEMTANDVIEIVKLLNQNDIGVIIDGGWAVDALLGEQTRTHEDLDVAVEHKDVEKIRALLEARGYTDVPRDDTRECNFVLGDDQGHLVDIHSYTFDEAGKIIFGVEYPYDSLNGVGIINGHPVRCISMEWLVKFHTGYKLDENDYHDVKLLCQRFGISVPEEYNEFVFNDSQPPSSKSSG
jgi:lincosamide nucleotidyltransferase A/C/D/E